GLFGASIGTVPSGLALIRIVDPTLRTKTAIELGLMNLPMTLATFITIAAVMPIASGAVSLPIGIALLLAPVPVYLILLKVFRAWGKKTYDFRDNPQANMTVQESRREVI